MSSILKFIFYVLGIGVISVVSVLGLIFIDQNDVLDGWSTASMSETFLAKGFSEARLDFAHPLDSRPIVVELGSSNSTDKSYRYIYPAQIFYATNHEIQVLFRDSIFDSSNSLGLEKLKERLGKLLQRDFYETRKYIINKAAISGVMKNRKFPHTTRGGKPVYHYDYSIRLINNEVLEITEKLFTKLTDIPNLAKVK